MTYGSSVHAEDVPSADFQLDIAGLLRRLGALVDLPWGETPEHKIEVVFDRWQNLPDDQRLQIERIFEDAEALANEEGLKTLIEEGQFHGLDLAAELEAFPNYRDKALHVWLNHPRVFQVAGTLNHAHALPQRFWHKRGNMPTVQPDVAESGIARFREAISAYYRREGRGQNCTVDAYLRVNRYHYFFAYQRNRGRSSRPRGDYSPGQEGDAKG